MSTRHARIELRPVQGSTKATQPHYLRLVAANGETLAHSEPYANRQNARRGADAWLAAFGDVWATQPFRNDGVVEILDGTFR